MQDSETRIFDDFRDGRIDYDEMQRRFNELDKSLCRGDLAVIGMVALAAIIAVLAVFARTG